MNRSGSEAVLFKGRGVVNMSLIQYSTTKQFRSNQSISTLVWCVFVGRGGEQSNNLLTAMSSAIRIPTHCIAATTAQSVKPHPSMNRIHIVNNFLFTMTGECKHSIPSPIDLWHPFVRQSPYNGTHDVTHLRHTCSHHRDVLGVFIHP